MRCLALAALLLLAAPAAAQTTATEADGTRTMGVEVWVPAAPAEVWQAVATAEGWKSWAVPAAWYVAPDLLETSYDPAGQPGGASNIQQRIVAMLPGRTLVFRNAKAPPGFPHADAFARVTQFLELSPDGTGTRVRLTGAGYPAGAEGDALLGFFRTGNRQTLDRLAARFGLAPLGFLAGGCWEGTLPTGERNVHCFDRVDGQLRDRHEVLRAGTKVYGGETLYRWDAEARAIAFAYSSGGKPMGKGQVRAIDGGLDFGTVDYGSAGRPLLVSTRWIRLGDNVYEARDESPGDARFTHNVRYRRVTPAPLPLR